MSDAERWAGHTVHMADSIATMRQQLQTIREGLELQVASAAAMGVESTLEKARAAREQCVETIYVFGISGEHTTKLQEALKALSPES